MRGKSQPGGRNGERGVALLIAIFSLLLVSVVAIALIVSSGTDTALAGNYRSSANAYYAAMAGIEEARGRLHLPPSDPNYLPLPSSPLPLTQVVYILNPAGGEVVAPQATGNPATYPDLQYKQEFGVDVSTRAITTLGSISALGGLPGPSFKWVRINAVTEQSMGNGGPGVDVNWDGNVGNTIPLFYDPENNLGLSPGLIENAFVPGTAGQALEITSFAVLPTGAQKMLQYVVRPLVEFPNLSLPLFPAPLTLAGPSVQFTGPGTATFLIQGQDQCGGAAQPTPAIGYTNNSPGDLSLANITAGAQPAANYQGAPMNPGPPQTPSTAPASIGYVGSLMNPNWLKPTGLDAISQDIANSADAVIQGPATPSSFPPGMSATHPMTIVVNGDLNLNAWQNTGYGLLLVTGTLYYDPDATWQGVILLIGQGNFVSTKAGTGEIDGAMFLAKTRDASNNLLGSLGSPSFSQSGGGPNLGSGIRFNSCFVKSAEGPITYKIIAFKEIPLLN
jgi:hypothetical protein